MDVLIVAQPTTGGVAVCVRQLARAAVEAGHRVTVACPADVHGPLAGWVAAAGASHHALDLRRSASPLDFAHVVQLRRLARGREVVHLHSSKAGAVGRLAVRSLGRNRPRVVFTPHAWSWLVNSPMRALYRWIERALAGWADAIVCVSEGERALGAAVLGAAHDLVVIPNGVDREVYSPEGPKAARTRQPLIVCVGRLSPQKGQDVAVRALAELAQPDAVLRLIGEGPDREALEELAVQLGVADRIDWVGHTQDVASHLRAADVVIAPSRWEGLSLVLLEAMASGAAVVASDVAGVEVLEGVGIVVSPGGHVELAREIEALLADDELRQRLGRLARQRSEEFALEDTLQRNLELWRQLVDGPEG